MFKGFKERNKFPERVHWGKETESLSKIFKRPQQRIQ